jgi:hypothetical protein
MRFHCKKTYVSGEDRMTCKIVARSFLNEFNVALINWAR